MIVDCRIYITHLLPQAPMCCPSQWQSCGLNVRDSIAGRGKDFFLFQKHLAQSGLNQQSIQSSKVHTPGVKLPVCQNGHCNC